MLRSAAAVRSLSLPILRPALACHYYLNNNISTARWLSTPGVGAAKTSTGLVGLPVDHDWPVTLRTKFGALLDRMAASDLPESTQYRKDVTAWCQAVLAAVDEHAPDDPEAVEDKIRMGQVEELSEMADDEMVALEAYLRAKLWTYLPKEGEDGPSVDFNPDPTADPAVGEVGEKLREGVEAMKKEAKK